MRLCPEQETCEFYQRGKEPPNHHVRITLKCIYWKGRCTYNAGACNLEKMQRIRSEMGFTV